MGVSSAKRICEAKTCPASLACRGSRPSWRIGRCYHRRYNARACWNEISAAPTRIIPATIPSPLDTKRFIDRHVTPGEKRPPAPSLRRGVDHACESGSERRARDAKKAAAAPRLLRFDYQRRAGGAGGVAGPVAPA
jgi:hypothetical protein